MTIKDRFSRAHWRVAALTVVALTVTGASVPAVSLAQPLSPIQDIAVSRAQPVSPIQHIVVLMQENHSFNNELGYWCNANPGRCPDGGMPSTVTLADGTVVTPGVTPDIVPQVQHSVDSQALGLSNNWNQITGCDASTGYACISGYQPSAVPDLGALASRYTILDRAFTLAAAPSWGGHLNELAGTTDGFTGNNPYPDVSPGTPAPGPGWGCDSNKLAERLPVNGTYQGPQPACVPDFSLGRPNGGAFAPTLAQHVPTIMDEMDSARVSWNIYAAATAPPGQQPDGAYAWSGCPSFADCLYTAQDRHLVDSNQYFADAVAGNLPSVSFVMPAGDNNAVFSQHNDQSNAAGDNWVGRVVSAAMTGPQSASTAVIVTYDDCGCFYDQVAPPLAPDGRQMGPRAPFVLISPYVKPGYTDTTATSNTGSILAFIEWNFDLSALGPNDAAANNLSADFNFTQAPLKFPRLVQRKLPARDYRLAWSTAHEAT